MALAERAEQERQAEQQAMDEANAPENIIAALTAELTALRESEAALTTEVRVLIDAMNSELGTGITASLARLRALAEKGPRP